ncbi:MAG: DNA alkylation repair protein [Chitinispirillaceae bacterium]|nr:DNA alkylation repair protein [Chitinispirillaceae bacterium]
MEHFLTYKDVIKELSKLGNKKEAENLSKFYKMGKGEYAEKDKLRGIKVPVLRKLVPVFSNISLEDIEKLLHSEYHEDRMLALFLMINKFNKGELEEQERIYKSYMSNTTYVNNWDLVDLSAPYIVGNYLYQRDRSPLYKLARSSIMWDRRIAIVSTFYFIRKNDFSDTLKIVKILSNDKEDLICKAMGWMLREVGKRDIETEEKFLLENISFLPRTTLRYAIERFPEEKRKFYLNL